MKLVDIIELSEIVAKMGHVKRATKLPNHEEESDSHHSFSLALIAYQIVRSDCPELDADKVVLLALCHDLLEIITGDENTINFTAEQFAAKHQREQAAYREFDELFTKFPDLRKAMYEYERLDTPEAATVFVLDKACTTWTHHVHKADTAREFGIHSRADVDAWADRVRTKITTRLSVEPPKIIMEIFEQSFQSLKSFYND